MRILVTGCAGFIGSHLCERLLSRGEEVVGLDCFDETLYPAGLHRDNLAALQQQPRFQFYEGDIADAALLGRALSGCDAIVHLAALAGVRPSLAQAPRYMRVNVEGTQVLLGAARAAGVRRFVFASSSSVYGAHSDVPFREDDPAVLPASPYAASKRAGELLCATETALYGTATTALRFFTVYGPRQRPEMAIHKFARLILSGQPVPLYGDGQTARDYTYIDDIIDGVVAAIERTQDPAHRVYNLGGSQVTTLRELVRLLEDVLARPARIEHHPEQPGDAPRTWADVSRAGAELGYAPRVPLREGLRRFVAWLRAERRCSIGVPESVRCDDRIATVEFWQATTIKSWQGAGVSPHTPSAHPHIRPGLRSLMIGDCDHYQSPYMLGVKQACDRLGIPHREVSIRHSIEKLRRVIDQQKPDILWTHMLLWAPEGSPPVGELVALMEKAARGGAKIVLHDGDYKERCRHPHDLSAWCALALCNHEFDRSAWKVPTLKWPYFAMIQDRIADPDPRWACGLFFAGQVGTGPVYAERTAFLQALKKHGIEVRMPTAAEGNTLSQTAVIAASAEAVLGFGRPGVRGWTDTRVTQYPGAGAILLHDDPGGLLEPWVHYAPYRSGSAESVVETLARLKAMSETERRALRERAFAFVQERHSSVARVRQVLDFLRPEKTP